METSAGTIGNYTANQAAVVTRSQGAGMPKKTAGHMNYQGNAGGKEKAGEIELNDLARINQCWAPVGLGAAGS